jgi:type II secretion system protein L
MILVWPNQDKNWEWCDSDNQQDVNIGLPTEQSAYALLPTERILLDNVELPKTRSPQKILPFAIEENIIDAPEAVHITFTQQKNSNNYAIAVINKKIFEQYKTSLAAEESLTTEAILPDVLALHWQEDTWTIACIGERCLIRYGAHSGIAISTANAAMIIDRLLQKDGTLPNFCSIHKCTPDITELLNNKNIRTETIDNIFSQQQIENTELNLAGKSKKRKKSTSDKSILLTTILLIIAALIFIGNAVANKVISNKISAKFAQNLQIIGSKLGPQAAQSLQNDPVGTLQSALAKLQHIRRNNQFLMGANKIGTILKSVTHGDVQSLSYDKISWGLKISATKNEQIKINSAFANSSFKYQVVSSDKQSITYKLLGDDK